MRVLAIGAHPDDIELGCGGTLRVLSDAGHEVHMLIMSDGAKGGNVAARRNEQKEAAAILRVHRVHWGGFEDTEIPHGAPAIDAIRRVVQDMGGCDLVLTHYPGDTHQDHVQVYRCSRPALRDVPTILCYQSASTTDDYRPNAFVDITPTYEFKVKSLEAHRSQVAGRTSAGVSILSHAEAAAAYWGMRFRSGRAEAFVVERLRLEFPPTLS